MGFKIDNDFGQMVKKSKDKQIDDEFDLQSEISNKSTSNIISRKTSFRLYQQQQFIALRGGPNRKDTKLEHVLEEDPQAEHDIHLGSHTSHPITKKNSANDVTQDRPEHAGSGRDTSIIRYRNALGASPQQNSEETTDKGLNFGQAVEQRLGVKNNNIKAALSPSEQPSVHGNILDLVSKREKRFSQAQVAGRDRGKSFVKAADNQPLKYFQPFVPDIDNFAGVKHVKNYCLVSLKDNGYGLGERSVGVLQLYNKLDGRRINKEDLARIQSLSKFIGALSQKAQDITNSLTLVIGMTQSIKEANYGIFEVDTTPGLGVFSSMMIPTESISKTIEMEEKAFKDQQDFEKTLHNEI